MEIPASLPGRPFIQDILVEKMEVGFRVKVRIGQFGEKVNLLIQVKDAQGSLLKEMIVIETPDEINSYVMHLTEQEGRVVEIIALLQNDSLGIYQQFGRKFQLS